MITDKNIVKLTGLGKNKFKPMKEPFELAQMKSMSISSGNDSLVIFHFGNGNDFIFYLVGPSNDNRVGELVGILAVHFER